MLEVKKISISELDHDPANVRRHSEKNIRAIKASLKRFGQQKPIVCDKNMLVRAGNGTLEAARALGWDEINVVISDLNPSELTAFAIADNRTAELAEWDMEALGIQLDSLVEEVDISMEDMGFEEVDVSALGIDGDEGGGSDPNEEWKGMPEFEQDDLTYSKVIVSFACEEDMKDFSELVGQSVSKTTKSMWFPEQNKESQLDKAYES